MRPVLEGQMPISQEIDRYRSIGVRLMSWYLNNRLIKIAGPKEKIQQFKVADPILQLFIMRYDGMIRWGGYTVETEKVEPTGEVTVTETQKAIKSEKDINEFIASQILPRVLNKANPENPNNNYLKKIDIEKEYLFARQNNIFNPELEQAYNLFKTDPVEGEKQYLDLLNGNKKRAFDGWTQYISQTPEYANNPAFAYMLLSPIFESSNEKRSNPPPSVNPAVVADTFQKTKRAREPYAGVVADQDAFRKILFATKNGSTPEEISAQMGIPLADVQGVIEHDSIKNIDLFKAYEKGMIDHSLKTAQHQAAGADEGWIKLPKKDKTQPGVNDKGEPLTAEQVYQENLKILDNFSVPNAWCTTINSNGPRYLSAGDFWILVKKNKAEVGLRFHDDMVAEIAGDQRWTNGQSRSCPTEFWKEVTEIIYKNNLQDKLMPSANYHWEEILKAKRLNASFFNPDGTPNIDEINAFKEILIDKPEQYNRVTDNENFLKFPEIVADLQRLCKEGWFKRINALHGHDAIALANNVADNAQNMPDFVLADPAFIENVHGKLVSLYTDNPERAKEVLDKVPNHWQVYPQGKQIFKQGIIKRYQEGLYWEANAYGAAKKTKQQKNQIAIAKDILQKMNETIGQLAPELNNDPEFEAAINTAKVETSTAALQKGYFSQDIPKEIVDNFFGNEQNINKMAEEFAKKIIEAPGTLGGKGKAPVPTREFFRNNTNAFSNKFIEKELAAFAPLWVRKTPGYKKFYDLAKNKALVLFRKQFPNFDPENKTPEMYNAYKQHMMRNDRPVVVPQSSGDLEPATRHSDYAENVVDPMLANDPDWQRESKNYKAHLPGIIKKIRITPGFFLKVPPEIQSIPEVYNVYIRARLFDKRVPVRLDIVKEYTKIPQFIKEKSVVKNGYIKAVRYLLLTMNGAKMTAWKLTCNDVDPIAFTDLDIVDYCQKQGMANVQQPKPMQPKPPIVNPKPPNEASVNSWYQRAIFSVK